MPSVAVVGLGAMGSRIARRLLDSGHEVVVWNRSPDKTAPLIDCGAIAASSPREAAAGNRILITMLADPLALRAVSGGPGGIAAGVHPELIVVEMSTVGPPAIRALASSLGPEVRLVDAPVLGSISEAESGQLTIFAGGLPEVVDEVEPLLATLGSVVRVGPLGAGAAAKLVANAALLGTLTVLGETLALADALELPRETTGTVLASTPLAEHAKRRLALIEAGDYPRRFGLSLARKDADLILDAGKAGVVKTPALAAARNWLRAAESDGHGEADYTAMLATMLRDRRDGRPDYDGLILDLDGVVWRGRDPIPGVAETLERLRARGIRLLFVTNDPRHSRATQARRLTEIGIAATAEEVLTASAAAAYFAATGRPLAPVDEAETAEIVAVGGHSGFDYAEFQAAPATGVTATTIGKPEPHLFVCARDLLTGCERVAVVGGNLAMDIVGAKQAGLEAILVLSGAGTREEAERAPVPPDLILPSLAVLA